MGKRSWWKLVLLAVVVAVGVRAVYEIVQDVVVVRENFTATDMEGRPWSLEEHRGRGPLVVSFFGIS